MKKLTIFSLVVFLVFATFAFAGNFPTSAKYTEEAWEKTSGGANFSSELTLVKVGADTVTFKVPISDGQVATADKLRFYVRWFVVNEKGEWVRAAQNRSRGDFNPISTKIVDGGKSVEITAKLWPTGDVYSLRVWGHNSSASGTDQEWLWVNSQSKFVFNDSIVQKAYQFAFTKKSTEAAVLKKGATPVDQTSRDEISTFYK